jgi:hypothetical protein
MMMHYTSRSLILFVALVAVVTASYEARSSTLELVKAEKQHFSLSNSNHHNSNPHNARKEQSTNDEIICPVYSCVGAGSVCSYTYTNTSKVFVGNLPPLFYFFFFLTHSYTDCDYLTICNYTNFNWEGGNGTCIALPGPGESCYGVFQCVDGYHCDYDNDYTCVEDSDALTLLYAPSFPPFSYIFFPYIQSWNVMH